MESRSYVSGDRGRVSNETISPSDTFARSKNGLVGWDLKTPCTFGTNISFSGQQAPENQGFGELGNYQDLIGQEVPHDSIRDALSNKVDCGKVINPFTVTVNAFPIEDESTSKLSSSVVDANSRGSSFFELQLGRCGDPNRDARDSRISKGVESSYDSSTPPMRVRVGVNSHTAYCQVYGCNKDLSSSKEYHKRHKVCEVHSKTAKVIVSGIEQRFCQQCSRFHLLAEFDDSKRSCRKRLAGHNERRRKPQFGIHSGRMRKLLQSYNGFGSNRFNGTALASAFICQDILPSGLLHPERHGTNDWCKRIKVEDGTEFSPLSATPITSGHLHSKSVFHFNNFDKMFPTFQENGAHTATGSTYSENINRYTHDLAGSNAVSRPLLQNTSLASEDLTAFDAASTIQGLSEITDSGCAPSLLSFQSLNSSSHSSGIPMARHLVVPGSNNHYSTGIIGLSSRASPGGVSNIFSLSGMSLAEDSLLAPTLISDGTDAINFDITGGIYQGSHFMNAKDHLSCENDTTIDLLRLSSQLQRVESQKQSKQAKQENDALCFSRIT